MNWPRMRDTLGRIALSVALLTIVLTLAGCPGTEPPAPPAPEPNDAEPPLDATVDRFDDAPRFHIPA